MPRFEELFAYMLGAIGLAYVIGLSAMTYFAIRFGIPVFGAPPPRQQFPPPLDDDPHAHEPSS